MKTAITVSLKNAFPQAMVVFRGLEDSLPVISGLGYDGVELALWRKDNIDASRVKTLLKRHALEVPVISTGQVFTMEKAWFTHPDQEIRKKAVDTVKGIVELAAEFDADVNISRVRGYIHDEDTREQALRRLSDCLEEVCRFAEPLGPKLLLEQMNMYETNLLHSVEEVGKYIQEVKIPNLRIHADTFHMNIHDVDMCAVLEKYSNLLGYIHFSDSNRLSPGSGHIDFPAIVGILEKVGYTGWAGIEVFTQPDNVEAARRSIEYLRKIYRGENDS
jgi:sugar phosphate isomerase/epimerase